jgi:hypothetical protein
MPSLLREVVSVLTLVLLTSLLVVSCGNTDANQSTSTVEDAPCNCIFAVIDADAKAGKIRNHSCEQKPLSQTIVDYVGAIRNFNYEGCPDEFKRAMLLHADAWNDLLPVARQFPDKRGEMHDLFTELKSGPGGEEFSLLVDEVWATWADVEKAGKICDTR